MRRSWCATRAASTPPSSRRRAYLFYEEAETAGPVLLGRQVECTKAPLGLKIFLNLAFRGERGLGEYVGGQYDKTLASGS